MDREALVSLFFYGNSARDVCNDKGSSAQRFIIPT